MKGQSVLKIKIHHGNKLFIKFFVSYLILLCFSITMIGIVYTGFERDKIDYFYKYNISMLEQSKYIIDKYVSELELLTENFESANPIRMLCSGEISADYFSANNYIDLSRALYDTKNRADIADNLYLYIADRSLIVSPAGVMSVKEFYNKDETYEKIPFEEFETEYLNKYHYRMFFGTGVSGQMKKSYITYSQSLPQKKYDSSAYKLLIQLSPERFASVMSHGDGSQGEVMMILSKSGDIVYCNSAKTDIDTKKLVGHLYKESDVMEITDKKQMITYAKSKSQNGWIYLVAVSKDKFLSEITRFKYIILLFTAGYLIFGIFLSRMLLKKNYRPIKLVMDKLGRDESSRYSDEMDFIHSVIRELKESNKDMKNVITRQSEQIKSDALKSIMSKSYSSDAIESIFEKLGFTFAYRNYAIVIVHAEGAENRTDSEKNMIYYALNNMAYELLGSIYNYEKFIDSNGNLVFAINVEDENEEAFVEDIKYICTLISDVMDKEFSVPTDISISSLRSGADTLRTSYTEAMAALTSRTGNITDYRDISSNRAIKMIADIEDYIDTHYMDNNLSNTTIADEFNITGQYLSVLFKKYKNENLQSYIARIRVGYAKELLKNKKYTIFQIANMVGYSNDIGFIRVFKKIEGITPGKYRQMNEN